MDIFGSITGLIVFFPIFIVLSILIRIDSPGPAIFKQKRIGKDGRPFIFYKFRTMTNNADETAHRDYIRKLLTEEDVKPENNGKEKIFKLVNDARITRIGCFLRKTSIDELPQLFNVLRGDMSLVGPRPPIPYEVELYEEWQVKRLSVIPGMTGLWQVEGRNKLGYIDSIQLDLEYIKNWSLWLDIKILFKTISVVFLRKGVA
ncbi:MAG: sugar transferase [Nitrospiraceae bacterium]|nr:MAG: sugar transferase [Nitrospiraceae bacterium]